MCPVRSVTYVSGRSWLLEVLADVGGIGFSSGVAAETKKLGGAEAPPVRVRGSPKPGWAAQLAARLTARGATRLVRAGKFIRQRSESTMPSGSRSGKREARCNDQ